MRAKWSILHLVTSVPRWGWSLFYLGTSTFSMNILSLAIPVFFMQIYDRVLPSGQNFTLIWLTMSVLIAICLEGLLSWLRGRLASRYAALYAMKTEGSLLRKFANLPPRYTKEKGFSFFDRKIRSIHEVEAFYKGQLFQSILDFPYILLFLGGIYFYGKELVFYHIGLLVLLISLYALFGIMLRKGNEQLFQSSNRRFMILSELLDKIHFIKAQSFEEFLLRRAEETLSQHALEEVLQNNRTLIPKLFSQIFSLLMIYGTILIGGILVIREGMSLGVVTACTMLARRAISPFQNISQFFLRLSQINANIRIQKEIHLKDSPDEPLPDIDWEGFLEFRDVSVPSEIPENKALDFSFMAFKGSIIVIDAAGTEWEENLLELLLGYQKPGKGRIILDNLIISHYNSDYLSDQYILLPRSVKLFRGSILQNITRFNPSLNSQGLDAATLMGLDPLIAKLPRGYETQIRGKHDPLSLPVLQRISLARAFLTRPRILIAHHCDDSMDSSTLSVFTELLRNNRNSCSAIVFSQNPEVQALADEIISINQDGEVTHIHPQREASHG